MTTNGHQDDRPVEARLREALTDRARTIEPSPGGLDHIEEELMSEPNADETRTRWIIGALSAAAAAVLVLVAVTVMSDDDDGDTDVAADTTSTTAETTTTTEATTTSSTPTTAFAPVVDPYGVAFPSPGTARRFDSPESVAQAYATDVLGFTELEVGGFRQGDSRSGEVPITDRPDSRETIVLVRQMEDDSWFALGSTTENITVDQPSAGDAISPPFATTGTALAFEGNVAVHVLTQDDLELVGESFVTGSGVPPAGPFEGEIDFDAPDEDRPGIVVYLVHSAEDGHVTEATSFPVRLQAG